MINGKEALRLLMEGNQRFVSGVRRAEQPAGLAQRTHLLDGQEPFAVVLGCSDSRVPVELIFDQGLGDLFVVRVAGNIAGPSQLGSIEYAAAQLGTRLVVVLGHTGCGAVGATLDELKGSHGTPTAGWLSISDRIRPRLEELDPLDFENDWNKLYRHAVRANVKASAGQLRGESETLQRLMDEDGLTVVGAEYSMETGVVDFFDDP